MGFRNALERLWRFLRPQWKAMTDREIDELDCAVAASMATGSFGLRPENNEGPVVMTGDRLWSLGSASQQTRASRVSEASSRGYEARGGYAVVAAAAAVATVVPGRQQQQQQQQQNRWVAGGPTRRPERRAMPDQVEG